MTPLLPRDEHEFRQALHEKLSEYSERLRSLEESRAAGKAWLASVVMLSNALTGFLIFLLTKVWT